MRFQLAACTLATGLTAIAAISESSNSSSSSTSSSNTSSSSSRSSMSEKQIAEAATLPFSKQSALPSTHGSQRGDDYEEMLRTLGPTLHANSTRLVPSMVTMMPPGQKSGDAGPEVSSQRLQSENGTTGMKNLQMVGDQYGRGGILIENTTTLQPSAALDNVLEVGSIWINVSSIRPVKGNASARGHNHTTAARSQRQRTVNFGEWLAAIAGGILMVACSVLLGHRYWPRSWASIKISAWRSWTGSKITDWRSTLQFSARDDGKKRDCDVTIGGPLSGCPMGMSINNKIPSPETLDSVYYDF